MKKNMCYVGAKGRTFEKGRRSQQCCTGSNGMGTKASVVVDMCVIGCSEDSCSDASFGVQARWKEFEETERKK